MRVARGVCLAVAVVGVLLVGPGCPVAAAPTGPPPIAPEATKWLSPRLVELTFTNPAVNPPLPKTKVRILVPGSLRAGARYPVVLLLHGIGDTSSAWTNNQDGWPVTLEAFTADKDVIIVMPDAGQNAEAGWYSDWYNGGKAGPPAWETYHLKQLLGYVDRAFPTRADRNGRVVAGLSMGGFGTMAYAARHPDLFAGAYSFSGALDNQGVGLAIPAGTWGQYGQGEVRRRGHNPVDLASNLNDVRVWFRIGMGLPGGPGPKDSQSIGLEAALWPTNELFTRALAAAGVTHRYEAYPLGGHNWYHWQQGFQLAWPDMVKVFAASDPAPANFRFRSIEPSFQVWGWDVAVERATTEFLQMTGVSIAGLTLAGSGKVALVTPPAYDPAATYTFAATGPSASVTPTSARPDADGRLRLTVTLGPSHTLEEFTPAQQAAASSDPGYIKTAAVTISRAAAVSTDAPASPPADAPASPRVGERSSAILPATGAESKLRLTLALTLAATALLASLMVRMSRRAYTLGAGQQGPSRAEGVMPT